MFRTFGISIAAAAALAACDSPAPAPTAQGPAVHATLARQFRPDTSPGRESAFSRDGKLMAVSAAGGRVDLIRLPEMRIVRTIRHDGGVAALAFSPAGATIATGGYDGSVRIWDVASGRALRTLPGRGGTIWSVDFASDGRTLAAAGEDSMIRLWDPANGRLLRTLKGHERNIWRVRFSPDGKHLASGSFDAHVKVWNVATGALLHDLEGHEQAVVGLDYSPDGKLIASGSDDSTIRIWRASDGRPLKVLGNGNHVYTVSFSPDGKWLASGGRARGAIGTLWHQVAGGGGEVESARIWRMSDGAVVAAIGHREDVMSVAFSPDGRWLSTASEDSVTRLWRVTPGSAGSAGPAG
jgi:WD40 repeat protein